MRRLLTALLLSCGDPQAEALACEQSCPTPPTPPSCTMTFRVEEINRAFLACGNWHKRLFWEGLDPTPRYFYWCDSPVQ